MSSTATLPLASEQPSPVVTVMIDPDTVLSAGGKGVLQAQLPPAKHQALVAGLIETLRLVTAAGP